MTSRSLSVLCGILFSLGAPRLLMGEPTAAAVAAFNTYTHSVEVRLARQHQSDQSFLALAASDRNAEDSRLRGGEVIIEQLLTPKAIDLPGAMLHHWRGTAFAPGATAADFERLMRDFNAYPQHFAPEVVEAKTLAPGEAWMRVKQRHVVTVVMDTTYDVSFNKLDVRHGYSISQSSRIDEVGDPGTKHEHVLGPGEEHGFLWRQNTYWSYEERDGGLYLQIESVSLTRSIPRGLGWAVGPYVESIPRESLEFTLRSASNAIRRSGQ